jgi:hypothetical protein
MNRGAALSDFRRHPLMTHRTAYPVQFRAHLPVDRNTALPGVLDKRPNTHIAPFVIHPNTLDPIGLTRQNRRHGMPSKNPFMMRHELILSAPPPAATPAFLFLAGIHRLEIDLAFIQIYPHHTDP